MSNIIRAVNKPKPRESAMYKKLLNCLLIFLFFVGSSTLFAAETSKVKEINKALSKISPDLSADAITETPVSGIYEVEVGAEIMYISGDGNYMFQGDLIDLNQMSNLTETRREKSRGKLIANLKEEEMIIFAPEKTKYTVTVFTDIDCGYCRKMHREMDDYNKLGIAIRYLAYPRSGVGTESYLKSVSAWCADDRKAAMTAAKTGKKIENNKCDNNPVQKHMEIGEMIGVRGTPSMVLEDGTFIPGYVPAERLHKVLEMSSASEK